MTNWVLNTHISIDRQIYIQNVRRQQPYIVIIYIFVVLADSNLYVNEKFMIYTIILKQATEMTSLDLPQCCSGSMVMLINQLT